MPQPEYDAVVALRAARSPNVGHRALQRRELLLRADDDLQVRNGRLRRQILDERLHLGNVHALNDELRRPHVEAGERSAIVDTSVVVDLPLPPSDPWQQAHVPGA